MKEGGCSAFTLNLAGEEGLFTFKIAIGLCLRFSMNYSDILNIIPNARRIIYLIILTQCSKSFYSFTLSNITHHVSKYEGKMHKRTIIKDFVISKDGLSLERSFQILQSLFLSGWEGIREKKSLWKSDSSRRSKRSFNVALIVLCKIIMMLFKLLDLSIQ